MSEHDAQDAVQGFFESILRRETFANGVVPRHLVRFPKAPGAVGFG